MLGTRYCRDPIYPILGTRIGSLKDLKKLVLYLTGSVNLDDDVTQPASCAFTHRHRWIHSWCLGAGWGGDVWLTVTLSARSITEGAMSGSQPSIQMVPHFLGQTPGFRRMRAREQDFFLRFYFHRHTKLEWGRVIVFNQLNNSAIQKSTTYRAQDTGKCSVLSWRWRGWTLCKEW